MAFSANKDTKWLLDKSSVINNVQSFGAVICAANSLLTNKKICLTTLLRRNCSTTGMTSSSA